MDEIKEQKKKPANFIDKSVDFIFSDNKIKYLIPIIILGFILRLIVVNHVGFIADEMVHGVHAIDIINSGVINEQNECPAWFYLTDIAYRLFGVNAFSARFLSLFFGTLTILLVYLVGRELFSEKIGLISAFIMAVSAYHIRYALIEMDEAMIFFILFAFYFFIRDIRLKKQIPYISAVLIGVAVLIKPIALTFIPAFAGYFIFKYYKSSDKKEFVKKNKSRAILFLLILLLFSTPVLAYNYILYKQKGITDILFSRFFKINPGIYSTLIGYDKGFSAKEAFSSGLVWSVKDTFLPLDPLIFIMFIIGAVIMFFYREYHNGRFFFLFHIITFIFLTGSSLLQTHFVSFTPLLCISSAVFIDFVSSKNQMIKKISIKKLFAFIFITIFIIQIFILWPYLSSQSAAVKVRNYAIANIAPNDIVVTDARIYRGTAAWMVNDKAYVEATYLQELLNLNQNLSGQPIPVNMYFLECAVDDCGWGYIKDQPELNSTMESLVNYFRQNADNRIYFNGGGGMGEDTKTPYYTIYQKKIAINPQVFSLIYQTHDWFYYPVRWEKSTWYDKYTPEGYFQVIFNLIGRLFLWAAVIIAIISPIILIKELVNINKTKNENQ